MVLNLLFRVSVNEINDKLGLSLFLSQISSICNMFLQQIKGQQLLGIKMHDKNKSNPQVFPSIRVYDLLVSTKN